MLVFEDHNGPIGQFNWFAVHPTAMNNTNTLINGDSKGWASNMLENEFKRQVLTNRRLVNDGLRYPVFTEREYLIKGMNSLQVLDRQILVTLVQIF